MKFGCLFIALLFMIPTIAFLPIIMDPADLPAPIDSILNTLICDGDPIVRETFRESYHRPGEVGVNMLCRDESGRTYDATGRFVMVVIASVILPILSIIFFSVYFSKNIVTQATTNRVFNTHTTTHNMSAEEFDKVKHSLGLGNINIGDLANPKVNVNESLTRQLKQIEEAYEQRMITREEYDDARQRILDNLGK